MSDYARDGLDLDDEDRLPWLEPADDSYEDEGVSLLKLLLFILAALVLLAAAVFGYWWVTQDDSGPGGEGALIAAPKGSYKIPAPADAKKIKGQGDASFAASEGVVRDGRIDPSRLPETPVTSGAAPVETAKAPAPAAPAKNVKAPVADETKGAKPVEDAPKPAASGGAMIQLGAYGSRSIANDAWSRMSKRFAYLAPLGTAIEEAKVGGNTYFRLRAIVPNTAEANTLCGKLKVAGESCIVVR